MGGKGEGTGNGVPPVHPLSKDSMNFEGICFSVHDTV